MDNTPTDVRMSPMTRFLFINAMRAAWDSISRAASSCPNAATAKHRFSGYPRHKSRCRSCGTPLFREAEPCDKCEGRGFIVGVLSSEPPCPKCLGTKVQ